MARQKIEPQYVVCICNDVYRASLQVRRLYRVLPDAEAKKRGLLRVIDESGEDYLFPAKLFATVELPEAVGRKLAKAS
ncbi:MAG: hypothetical protein KAV82_07995 [Phycisphaerae bacterium]|nr:hypothetical protein [Phycisphaerae bacterium]